LSPRAGQARAGALDELLPLDLGESCKQRGDGFAQRPRSIQLGLRKRAKFDTCCSYPLQKLQRFEYAGAAQSVQGPE
jgi:hypothetical protein